MNNRNVNENNSQPFFQKISSHEFLSLSSDFIPSFIYIFLITFTTYLTPSICDQNFPLIFRSLIIVYSAFIVKGLFHGLLIKLSKMSISFYNMIISTTDFILNLVYYIVIILGYFTFTRRNESCFFKNLYMTSLLFYLILIGFVNLSQMLLNICLIIICFPIMIYYCVSDPNNFYVSMGIDPEIVNNLPTVKANKLQCSECVICVEPIREGEEIIILKCPGHHYFHDKCIKEWLLHRVSCPICRCEEVL